MSTGNYEMGTDVGGLGAFITPTQRILQFTVARPTELWAATRAGEARTGVPVGVGVRVTGTESRLRPGFVNVWSLGGARAFMGKLLPRRDLIQGGAGVTRQILGLGEADVGGLGGRYLVASGGPLVQGYVTARPLTIVYTRQYGSSGRMVPSFHWPSAGTRVTGTDLGSGWVRLRLPDRSAVLMMRKTDLIAGGAPYHALDGFGEAEAAAAPDTSTSDFLSMLGKLAIPVLVIGAGVYIGSKLAKAANRKANRRRNRRRNPPFRVSYSRDFDALTAARTDYGRLPSAGYTSVRDLGKAGGKLKGGGRWRTKLIAKRGGF